MENRTKLHRIGLLFFEVIIYVGVMGLYVSFVLQVFSKPLATLYKGNINWYSAVVVLLIILQAVLLEFLVSFLIRSLGIFKLRE